MLTKEYIARLKKSKTKALEILIKSQKEVGGINFILENLGPLPTDFDSDFLYELLDYPQARVRRNAIKNIAKLSGRARIDKLMALFGAEKDTSVRREIVSVVGGQWNKNNKSILFSILGDADPKIVCQAIRGLLALEKSKDIEAHLRPLINHANEMVRTVIYKEYFSQEREGGALLAHTETYDYLKNVVVNADVLDALAEVPDDSVHLTFTSPPYYNARDYSIYASYEAYLEFLDRVFRETHRITKEGRFLIINTSPIIMPRVSRSHASKRYGIPFDLHGYLVKSGWEFVDDIIWLKPESTVKNRAASFSQHRKPLGYKPNAVTEYLMVYRKSTEKLLDWNMRSYPLEIVEASRVGDGYESSNVWRIDPCFDKVHSAIFPVELCKRVIQYYSYKNDLVFDPFGGSGTVGRVARSLGRYFFLTEKEPAYFEYMKSQAKENSVWKESVSFFTLEEFRGYRG